MRNFPAIGKLLAIGFVAAIPAFATGCGAVGPEIGSTGEAIETPTTGQPGAPNNTCGSPGATQTPGNAANAPGSAFNPNGQAGTVYAGNPGTSSLTHSNSTATVSQYDSACVHVTEHH
jgi:hypothetical protein